MVIIWLIDVVFKQNRKGPRTDPCGTPKWRSCGHESDPSMWMRCCLFEMYDLNHCKTIPEMPKCPCSRSNSVAWSIVPKAADRSNSVRAVTLPLSMLHIISLWIFEKGCFGRMKTFKQIVHGSITTAVLLCVQAFGYNLLQYFWQKAEVGYWTTILKFIPASVFFLIRGVTRACLKSGGSVEQLPLALIG